MQASSGRTGSMQRPYHNARYVSLGLLVFCLAHATARPEDTPASTPTLLEQAFSHDEGSDGKRDAATAAKLYRQAADSGDAFAHLRLGYLSETGDGVPQDYAAARTHYQAAVDAGLTAARVQLAICHLEGWGGPADRSAFVREIRTAAEAGEVSAQQVLAHIYFLGFGVPEDRSEGLRWLESAAKQESVRAQYQIGMRLEEKLTRNLMPDFAVSRNWYRLSAEQEYQTAMRAMARTFLMVPHADRNWALGQRWLELSTETGDAEAPYILAYLELLHPDTPNRNEAKARSWLELAAERKNQRARELLELAASGRSLADSMTYMLSEAADDRYLGRANQHAADQIPGSNAEPPRLVRAVAPDYPLALNLARISGTLELEFTVDTKGKVIEPRVVKSPHPLFEGAALAAIVQWQFRPARKNGRLVNVRVQVPMEFSLEEELLDGVDGLLSQAKTHAEKLGTVPASDYHELRMGKLSDAPLSPPTLANGEPLPADSAAMFIVCVNAAGTPLRVHALWAEPAILGPELTKFLMQEDYEPRLVDGVAVPSNLVVIHATGAFRRAIEAR